MAVRPFSSIGYGVAISVGCLGFLLVARWLGIDTGIVASLVGAILGAAIAASVQIITSRSARLDSFRLAAVERRLQAHQEAFALWLGLFEKVHRDYEIEAAVQKCQEWWKENCLFLDGDAREAFRTSYLAALNHKDFLQDRSNVKAIKENWARMCAAGDAITKAVHLPPVGDLVNEHKTDPQDTGS